MALLLLLAVAYWLAAPDPATAGARTAAGTGVRAAGAGARQHWAAGRDGRKLGRSDRRDRWSRSGGFWRNLLRLEHGAVIGGKAAKGAGKLTAAAVRPVPAAVKAGWVQGRDRHRAKAGGRPAGLTLDPPWWRGVQPQVQDPGAGGEQVQVQPGDSPEVQVGGQVDLDTEEQIRDRRSPSWSRTFPAPLTEADRRFWTARDGGYSGPLDQDGRPGDPEQWPFKTDPDPTDIWQEAPTTASWELHCANCGKRLEYNLRTARPRGVPVRDDPDSMWCPECARSQPADPPAGTSPAGTPAIPTEGDPVPSYTAANVPSIELNDLDSLRRFAEYISSLGEDSEFMQIVDRCKALREQMREGGFGGHVDQAGASFEETAAALGQLGTEFCEEAAQMAQLAADVAGG